jgi:hypothetical protein
MKQYIEPEQLNLLSPEKKERLKEWWKPQRWDRIYLWHPFERSAYGNRSWEDIVLGVVESGLCIEDPHGSPQPEVIQKEHCLPLLTIGQCLELLVDKGYYPSINLTPFHWDIVLYQDEEAVEFDSGGDLVNELWDLVCEVI